MNSKKRYPVIIAIIAFVQANAHGALAYQVVCQGTAFTATQITSVLGEARCTPVSSCDNGGIPDRFHMGVDIGNLCSGSQDVEAIYGGTVTLVGSAVPGCSGTTCIRIQDSPSHAFDYIHVVDQLVVKGSTVSAGETIGFIDPTEKHLHLDEVDLTTHMKVNPETNGLEFTDDEAIQFPSESLGNGVPVIPIPSGQEGTINNAAGLAALKTFPQQADGTFLVLPQVIDILANLRYGPSRKGVYSVGAFIAPQDDPTNFIYDAPGNMFFDEIPDNNSSSGISTVYLWRYSNADAYFAANEFLNGQALDQSDPDLRDPSQYPAGNYFACVGGAGLIDSSGAANIDAFCAPFILDRGPRMTMKGYNQSVYAPPNPAIWTRYFADFSLSAPDYLASFNVYNDASESQNLFSESFEPGVSIASDVFVGVFSATEAASNFPDGIAHLAVLSDQLGQETSGYFSYDATQPTVSVSNVQTSPPLGSLPPWFISYSGPGNQNGTEIQGVSSECPTFTVTGNASDNLAGMTEI